MEAESGKSQTNHLQAKEEYTRLDSDINVMYVHKYKGINNHNIGG